MCFCRFYLLAILAVGVKTYDRIGSDALLLLVVAEPVTRLTLHQKSAIGRGTLRRAGLDGCSVQRGRRCVWRMDRSFVGYRQVSNTGGVWLALKTNCSNTDVGVATRILSASRRCLIGLRRGQRLPGNGALLASPSRTCRYLLQSSSNQ